MSGSTVIIKTGSDRAISFTDDTSPDTRKTKKRNVSISGQVRRHNSLEWFYKLLFLCRSVKSEVKSPHAVEAFRNISWYQRNKLWETLKEVQINISDPLPYQVNTSNLYEKITNKKDTIDMLRQRAIAKDQWAINLLEKLSNHTAEQILFDAPSRQLSWNLHYAKNPYGYGYGMYVDKNIPPPDHKIDLSRLKSKKSKSIIRAATEYTAKSASAFSDAIEASKNPSYFLHNHPALNPVYRELKKAHAFDKGNERYIELMEVEREEINLQMNRRQHWFEYYDRHNLEPLEGEIDSEESYFIQASDFAAGIASHLYEDGGIFPVTLNFEYVMFNGKRISQNEAFETMKKWQELGYFN